MCLFCDIIESKIPSYTLYEDEVVKCFLDLNQECLGHTLVVPKVHTLDVTTIDNNTLLHVFDVAKLLEDRITNKLKCDGFSLMINSGNAQDIKHFHMHIMPKYLNKQENMDMDKLYSILKED